MTGSLCWFFSPTRSYPETFLAWSLPSATALHVRIFCQLSLICWFLGLACRQRWGRGRPNRTICQCWLLAKECYRCGFQPSKVCYQVHPWTQLETATLAGRPTDCSCWSWTCLRKASSLWALSMLAPRQCFCCALTGLMMSCCHQTSECLSQSPMRTGCRANSLDLEAVSGSGCY